MESQKTIFASIVAAGILGTTAFAWAQPDKEGPEGCDMRHGRPGMMKSSMKFDPAARAEQRLARLKAEIKPTAEQEPLWNAFAEKATAQAGKGMRAMLENARDEKLTAPERMARMNEAMKERLAANEAVTDSFKRLYDHLTPEQKQVADKQMSRMGRGERGAGRRHGPGPQGMDAEAGRSQG